MRKGYPALIVSSLLCCTQPACAQLSTGFAVTLPLISKDPPALHGYRAALSLQPASLVWPHARVYFDAGFGHWWVSKGPFRTLSIYTLAPVLRYYFMTGSVSPFVHLSVGASWLSAIHFEKRKLGIHFSFQDEAGLGLAWGKSPRISVMLSSIHYSNGSIAKHNSGITIPLLLTVALSPA